VTRLTSIRPEFVEFVPTELEDGVLYISTTYRTAVHRCACGCGSKITTPIRPPRWRFTYDGETVSLYPSIGNWSYPCQSHYWIEHNRIEWAPKWSQARITAGRARDRADRQRYYRRVEAKSTSSAKPDEGDKKNVGLIRRLWQRLVS
jgi:Family of unknown function (DUF6527)